MFSFLVCISTCIGSKFYGGSAYTDSVGRINYNYHTFLSLTILSTSVSEFSVLKVITAKYIHYITINTFVYCRHSRLPFLLTFRDRIRTKQFR